MLMTLTYRAPCCLMTVTRMRMSLTEGARNEAQFAQLFLPLSYIVWHRACCHISPFRVI